MTRYTLYLGLMTRDNAPVKPSIRNAVLDDAVRSFGGYTVMSTTGGYRANNGFTIQEPALRIEVITDADPVTVRAWAERARLLATQESVLLTADPVSADFISDTNGQNDYIAPQLDFVPEIGR